jgi:hypothetical protein
MVDYEPWKGNFTDTVVWGNTIMGGFATSQESGDEKTGPNLDDAIIKSAVFSLALSCADPYLGLELPSAPAPGLATAIATMSALPARSSRTDSQGRSATQWVSSAKDFTVKNNVIFGSYTFIGKSGPNCSTSDIVPTPAVFVYDNSTTESPLQEGFQLIPGADSLTYPEARRLLAMQE